VAVLGVSEPTPGAVAGTTFRAAMAPQPERFVRPRSRWPPTTVTAKVVVTG
jgi:hypothetical protein